MTYHKKKYFFIGAMSLALFCGIWNFTPVFSYQGTAEEVGGSVEEIDDLQTQIDARRKKIAELEKSIADYKQKISEKKLEVVSLSNQIGILDNRIGEINVDIEATEQKLQVLSLEITQTELTINQKEQQIGRQKNIVSELVRSLHQEDGKNYIEIAASHDNFSDFYNQLHYTKTIEQDLGKTMRGLRLAKEELEGQKKGLEDQKTSHTKVADELKNKKQDMVEQSKAKEGLLVVASSTQLKYNTLLSSLKAQYQQTENEISGIERQVRKKLSESKKIKPTTNAEDVGAMAWPTPSRYVTASFHDSTYPFRHVFEHSGIDIRASQGTAIKAAASGYIGRAKKCTLASCYSYVLIVHDGGLSTVYGHLSKVSVGEEQFVTRGDIIGYSGGTPGTAGAGPFVTGAHLHFEVRKDGIPVNPLNYLGE